MMPKTLHFDTTGPTYTAGLGWWATFCGQMSPGTNNIGYYRSRDECFTWLVTTKERSLMLIYECKALRIPLDTEASWSPDFLERTAEHYVRQWLYGKEPPHVGYEALQEFASKLGIKFEDIDENKILPMVPIKKQSVPGAKEKRDFISKRRKSSTPNKQTKIPKYSKTRDKKAVSINSSNSTYRSISELTLIDAYKDQTSITSKRGLSLLIYEILESCPSGMAMHYREIARILLENGHKKPTTPEKNFYGSVSTAILRIAEIQRSEGGWVWII